MAKRKPKKPPNPTAADLPQNPEFQEFVGNLRQILSVPKSEIDRMLCEERESKDACIGDPPVCD
ncbi:MAG: hypothetical protein ACYC96_09560 [Fimbriimonadaceae bacterium]